MSFRFSFLLLLTLFAIPYYIESLKLNTRLWSDVYRVSPQSRLKVAPRSTKYIFDEESDNRASINFGIASACSKTRSMRIFSGADEEGARSGVPAQTQQRSSINSYGNANSGKISSRRANDAPGMNRQVAKVLAACRGEGKIGSLTDVNHAIISAGRIGRADYALQIFRALTNNDINDKGEMGYSKEATYNYVTNNNLKSRSRMAGMASKAGDVPSAETATATNFLPFSPDLMSFNNCIWSLGNNGRLDLAKRLFEELQTKTTLRPNVYTYGSLIHSCAKSRNYQQALLYLDRMEEDGIVPNQIVFTSAMEACAECGKYKEALKVMESMRAQGIKPDLTMINAGIKACCLGGAMEEAESLADTLRDYGAMDLFTYHTLMMGHTKLARHHRVLALYEEALASSAQLDGGVYSLAMLAALNCGLYQQVPRIANRARSESVSLTEASYTILMQALGEAGGSDQAVACLDLMVEEGLKPNVISYAAAMAACCGKNKGHPEVVLSLLERMKTEGIPFNTVVLTTAINALAREGGKYTDAAFQMLQDMEISGPEPNIYTYNTVTRAFAEEGRLEEAMLILRSIKARRLQPDRFTFTTLLMACGRTNNSEQVSAIMLMMKESGVVPDEIAYGAAIDAHRRAGNALEAIECLNDMQRQNIEPTASHYNLVLRALKANGYVDKMFKMVFMLSAKEGIKINGNSFELTIEALLEDESRDSSDSADKGRHGGRWREALVLVKIMNRTGVFQPSLAICVRLVEALERARQFRAVLAMYKLMVRYGYDFYENDILNGIFKNIVSVAAKAVEEDINLTANEGLGSSDSTSLSKVKSALDEDNSGSESYYSLEETELVVNDIEEIANFPPVKTGDRPLRRSSFNSVRTSSMNMKREREEDVDFEAIEYHYDNLKSSGSNSSQKKRIP